MNARELWRERLRPLVGFPGLLLLAFVIERMVLAPHAAERPPESAVAFWAEQAERHPDFPLTQVRLGFECLRANDLHGARAAFERALAEDPHAEQAAIGLDGVLRAQGDTEGTVTLMESFLRENPACAACEQNLAASLFALGRLEDARRHVESVLQQENPKVATEYGTADLRGNALALAGRIYAASGDPQRARALFQQALARQPKDAAVQRELEQLDRLDGTRGSVR